MDELQGPLATTDKVSRNCSLPPPVVEMTVDTHFQCIASPGATHENPSSTPMSAQGVTDQALTIQSVTDPEVAMEGRDTATVDEATTADPVTTPPPPPPVMGEPAVPVQFIVQDSPSLVLPRDSDTQPLDPISDDHGYEQLPLTNDSSTTFRDRGSNPLSTTMTFDHSPLIHRLCTMSKDIVGADPFSDSNKVLVDKLCTLAGALTDSTHLDPPSRVVNLSSRQISTSELTLLQKGLNFCPTPGEPKMGDLVNDLDYFHDNLRWQYHFLNTPPHGGPF